MAVLPAFTPRIFFFFTIGLSPDFARMLLTRGCPLSNKHDLGFPSVPHVPKQIFLITARRQCESSKVFQRPHTHTHTQILGHKNTDSKDRLWALTDSFRCQRATRMGQVNNENTGRRAYAT